MDKLSKDVAEAEFNRFGEMMDLDFNVDMMDVDDLKGFNNQKNRVVSAIQAGALVVTDIGEPVFTPQRTPEFKEAITFHEPTGATFISMDKKKAGQDMGKLYTIMQEMTGVHAGQLSKLRGSDAKVCQAVLALFLA